MKQSPTGDIQEINSSKLKINISRSYNTDTNNPSLINKLNLENKAQPKRIQNNINLGNNDLNTSNTNENVPSMSTSLLQKLVNKADKLEIEIINSLSENSNSTIEINTLGMVQGSKRKAKDGITYFGLIDEDNSYIDTNNNNNQDVDYIINTNEIINEENNNLLGRHFRIRFDINTMKYYIKDLGRGFGTFKKNNK